MLIGHRDSANLHRLYDDKRLTLEHLKTNIRQSLAFNAQSVHQMLRNLQTFDHLNWTFE